MGLPLALSSCSGMDLNYILNDSPLSPRRSQSPPPCSAALAGPRNGDLGSSSRQSLCPGPSVSTDFIPNTTATANFENRHKEKSPAAGRKPKSRASARQSVDSHGDQLNSIPSGPTPAEGCGGTAPARILASCFVSAQQQPVPKSRSRTTATESAKVETLPIKRLSKAVAGRWAWFCPVCEKEFKSGGHCKTHIATVSSPSGKFLRFYSTSLFHAS